MRTNSLKFLLGSVLSLALAQTSSAYSYILGNTTGQPVKWTITPVVMHVRVTATSTTLDPNLDTAVMTAIASWNANMATTQLSGSVESAPPPATQPNSANEMFFATDIYGTAFGSGTLAVTTNWLNGYNSRFEADIVFNGNSTILVGSTTYNLSWSSYSTGLNVVGLNINMDMGRIALHELGHVLGLGHATDPASIMYPSVSNVIALTADDITPVNHLYGIPGQPAPGNDNFANATLVTLSNGSPNFGSNVYPNLASRQAGEPLIAGNPGGHSVWWKWVAPYSGSATIDTYGSYFDTLLGVYTGSAVNALTLVGENDDDAGAGAASHTSSVTFSAAAGTTYYIAVDGYYYDHGPTNPDTVLGDRGDITLHVTQSNPNVAPSFTTNPSNTTVAATHAAYFTAVASGTPTPSMQWQCSPITGGGFANLPNDGSWVVNGNTITLGASRVGIGNNGDQYRCVATNIAGSATSTAAILYVAPNVLPSITSQPQPQTLAEGATATFTVAATSFTTMTYAWQESPDSGANWYGLGDGNGFSGTQTATLTLTGTQYAQHNGLLFRCEITNLSGSVDSNSALLTLTVPPAIVQVSAGKYHSLRTDAQGQFWATGGNSYGQLGTGNTTQFTSPQLVTLPGGRVVAAVSAGSEHSLLLTTAGELWAMGLNANGQLGIGSSDASAHSTPVQIASNVVAIAAGKFHSAFLKNDGTLWTVGGNDEGQVGNGSTSTANVLTPYQLATNVVDLAAGTRQTLFVKADGTAWGTGDLYNNGTLNWSPIQIATGVRTVAAGGYHSLYLKTDTSLYALGFNAYGQLGDNTTTTRTSPVLVTSGVKAIATGPFHSAYILTSGQLCTFGLNSSGQLGDNSIVNRPLPTSIYGNVVTVTAGETTTLFTCTDGSLRGMGSNLNGQFGIASPTSSIVKMYISGGVVATPSVPTAVAAAGNAALDRMNVTWVPTPTALGYEVWRNTTNNFGTATRIAQNVRWGFYQDLTAAISTTYYYWVVAVNAGGSSSPSTGVSGYYSPPVAPGFSTQPSAQSVGTGSPASFTVVATGWPVPTLQWQRLPAGSGTWSDLSNAGSYSGVTTGTLTVTGTTLAMNGDQFRCVATNSSGSVNSNGVLLTVTGGVANDFNGDGKSDIILQNMSGGDRGFWLMNGTAFSSWVDMGYVSPNWRIAATADFNGDGKPDLLWENTVTGDRGFWLMNGTTYASWVSMGWVSTDWRIAAAGDFNGDGKTDILWENTVTGVRGFWIMNGTAYSSWVYLNTLATDWRIAGVGDFNGDGQTDILWQNTSNGVLGFWLMNGTAYSSWLWLNTVSTDWRIAAVGDYNGDGKPDILWENTVTGDRGFWLMNGTAFGSWVDIGIVATDWDFAN